MFQIYFSLGGDWTAKLLYCWGRKRHIFKSVCLQFTKNYFGLGGDWTAKLLYCWYKFLVGIELSKFCFSTSRHIISKSVSYIRDLNILPIAIQRICNGKKHLNIYPNAVFYENQKLNSEQTNIHLSFSSQCDKIYLFLHTFNLNY